MSPSLLDNPLIISMLFFPRTARPSSNQNPTIVDGTIPIPDTDIVLGYRFFIHQPTAPLLLFFHGNGEVASDYNGIATMFHDQGLSLLVVDYRGYGWSTGKPLISTLGTDAEAVLDALPNILQERQVNPSGIFLMGRSLGSAPSIHLAYQYPEKFKGLIVESGFADTPSALKRFGIGAQLLALFTNEKSPIGNASKMKKVSLPLLIIHGKEDTLLPPINGETLYEASPSTQKSLVIIPHAGHNDLMVYGVDAYFAAVKRFVEGNLNQSS